MGESPIKVNISAGDKTFTRFLDVIAKGVGGAWKPLGDVLQAKADATKAVIEARSRQRIFAIEASGMPRLGNSPMRLEPSLTPLIVRAEQREELSKLESQGNIECIAEHAAGELVASATDEPVNADWRRRFFAYAEDVCDADLQQLWGRVLAGEVSKPRSYSLRALEVLRTLTNDDAMAFVKLCSISTIYGDIFAFDADPADVFKHAGFDFETYMNLADCGLASPIRTTMNFPPDKPNQEIPYKTYTVRVHRSANGAYPKVPSFALTRAGKELMRLAEEGINLTYLVSSYNYLHSTGHIVEIADMDGSDPPRQQSFVSAALHPIVAMYLEASKS